MLRLGKSRREVRIERVLGPKGRHEIAPTVRSGYRPHLISRGPKGRYDDFGPSDLGNHFNTRSPTSRSGLFHFGPSGLLNFHPSNPRPNSRGYSNSALPACPIESMAP